MRTDTAPDRRCADKELKSQRSQWPELASLGDWTSLAFKVYVDLSADVSRDTSNLSAETEPPNTDHDDD